ncbi:leucine-rich repeat protein [Enterococcus sp. DIV1420a]|uniref:leucine-rich repeat protein n=1 Tax=Enterococcus sp. DIV1420a TaxID=2774672 RepID=UPI003F232E7B
MNNLHYKLIGKNTFIFTLIAFIFVLGNAVITKAEETSNIVFKSEQGVIYKVINESEVQIGDGENSILDLPTDLTIPEIVEFNEKQYSVTKVGAFAFSTFEDESGLVQFSGSNVENLNLPKTIEVIDKKAFHSATNLKTISFPLDSSLREIADNAFEFAGLTKFTLPDSVETIGNNAFIYNNNLVELNINKESKLKKVGQGAFKTNPKLKEIYIPEGVLSIGDAVFSGDIGLKNIIVDSKNLAYASLNGVLFTKDLTELIVYPADKIDLEYTLPKSVSKIADYAFEYNTSLRKITLNDELKEIGDFVFKNMLRLEEFNMGNQVETIGRLAFYNIANLTQLVIPDSVSSYGSNPFYNLEGLRKIVFGKNTNNLVYGFIGGEFPVLEDIVLKSENIIIDPDALNFYSSNDSKKIKYNVSSQQVKEELIAKLGIPEYNIELLPLNENSAEKEPTATEQPTTSAEKEPTATEQPTTSAEKEPTATEQPTTSAEKEPTATEQPTTSAEKEPTATEQPTTSAEKEPTATEQPVTNAEKEPTATEQPITNAEKEPTATEQPTTNAEKEPTATEQPTTSAEKEPIATEQPVTNAEKEPTATEQPITNAEKEPTATEQPTTNAEKEPTATEQPTTSAEKEPTATEQPTTSAEKEPTETEQPTTTTLKNQQETSLIDRSTRVYISFLNGVTPKESTMSVSEITIGSVYDSLKSDYNKIKLFDISLLDSSGNKVQPKGNVLVHLPIPDNFDTSKTKVYYINDNGTRITMNGYVDGEYYVFETTHFSYYALVQENTVTSSDYEETFLKNDDVGKNDTQFEKTYLDSAKQDSIISGKSEAILPQTGGNTNYWLMLIGLSIVMAILFIWSFICKYKLYNNKK